jgi:hypothetical protein
MAARCKGKVRCEVYGLLPFANELTIAGKLDSTILFVVHISVVFRFRRINEFARLNLNFLATGLLFNCKQCFDASPKLH